MIKICGLRDASAAIAAARHGADLLGFIFAPSRRQITAQGVAEIVAELRAKGFGTPTVGVFVDPIVEQLREDIEISGIDLVQLSGDESPDLLDHIDIPVIKAIPAGVSDTPENLRQQIAAWNGVYLTHLDASDPTARGGTGKRANWNAASEIASSRNIMLAGGLDADNVADAIAQVKPFGVDVSTGVETNGVKDAGKIERFIRNARAVS